MLKVPFAALPEIVRTLEQSGCHVSSRPNGYRIEIPGWELLGQDLGIGAGALALMQGQRILWDEIALDVSRDSGVVICRWRYWRMQTILLHAVIALMLLPYCSSGPRFFFAFILSQFLPVAMSFVIWRESRRMIEEAVVGKRRSGAL